MEQNARSYLKLKQQVQHSAEAGVQAVQNQIQKEFRATLLSFNYLAEAIAVTVVVSRGSLVVGR